MQDARGRKRTYGDFKVKRRPRERERMGIPAMLGERRSPLSFRAYRDDTDASHVRNDRQRRSKGQLERCLALRIFPHVDVDRLDVPFQVPLPIPWIPKRSAAIRLVTRRVPYAFSILVSSIAKWRRWQRLLFEVERYLYQAI